MSVDGGRAVGASIRPADLRFLTPSIPRRVALEPPAAADVASAWERAGVEVSAEQPELVVTSARGAAAAAAGGAASIIVEGGGGRRLSSRGYVVRHFVTRAGPAGPRLVVPTWSRAVVAHAFGIGTGGRSARAAAVEAMVVATAHGLRLPFGLTVATKERGLPSMLQGAEALGLPANVEWYLQAGTGDDLQRLVWLCFVPGDTEPSWAVKSSRVQGYADSLVADEAGLGLLAEAPASVRAHVAESAGRFEVAGHHGSLERAARGRPLHVVLGAGRSRRSRLDLVRAVGAWVIDLGRATALPPDRLEPERRRLAEVVIPQWRDEPLPSDLLSALPPLAAVAAHNDLGPWNILSDGRDFTVVDWESASRAAMPLWDLLYFCTDALVTIEGGWDTDDEKRAAMLELLAGRAEASATLFDLAARGAEAAGVPHEAVGRVATLAWLHHGCSPLTRTLVQRRFGVPEKVLHWPLQDLVTGWLRDPALGPDWPAFRAAAG